VRDVGRDFERFAGAQGDLTAANVEYELPGMDHRYLLVDVIVQLHVAALLEFELGDGHARGVDDAAVKVRGDFFEGDVIPVMNRHRHILTEA